MDSYDNEWILLLVLDDDLFWRDDDVESVCVSPHKTASRASAPEAAILNGVLVNSSDD